jgi:hypothetical protein
MTMLVACPIEIVSSLFVSTGGMEENLSLTLEERDELRSRTRSRSLRAEDVRRA